MDVHINGIESMSEDKGGEVKFCGQEVIDQDVKDCKVRVVVIDSNTDFNGLTQVGLSFTENNKTLKT